MGVDPNILKRTGENKKKKVSPRDALGYAGHLKTDK